MANGSKPNTLIGNIPAEAFKKVVCDCGCDLFQQGYALLQYPGGIYSSKKVTRPMPVMVCWSCGQAYNEKTAKTVDGKVKDGE